MRGKGLDLVLPARRLHLPRERHGAPMTDKWRSPDPKLVREEEARERREGRFDRAVQMQRLADLIETDAHLAQCSYFDRGVLAAPPVFTTNSLLAIRHPSGIHLLLTADRVRDLIPELLSYLGEFDPPKRAGFLDAMMQAMNWISEFSVEPSR